MSVRRPMNDDERKARELLRTMDSVTPDATFAADLRRRFVEGRLGEDQPTSEATGSDEPSTRESSSPEITPSEDDLTTQPDETTGDPARRARPRVATTRRAGHRSRRTAGPEPEAPPSRRLAPILLATGATLLTAAAALLLWVRLDHGAWELAPLAADAGSVTLNGRSVAASELNETDLLPGTIVETDETTELTMTSGDQLVFVITPNSRVELPSAPGRRWNRDVTASFTRGEIRISTGPSFTGAQLTFSTPEADVMALGTTYAVLRNEEATCVCVFEGTVLLHDKRVRGTGGGMLPEGERRVLSRLEPVSEELPLEAGERMKLSMLRDASNEQWAKE